MDHPKLEALKKAWHEKRSVTMVYILLRTSVVLVMLAQIFNRNFENVFLCVLTLILFMLPSTLERKLDLDLPNTLEIIILLFIFASEILGELKCYFITYPHWDSMLHTTTGFLCAATGFALIDILNRNSRIKFQLSPVYVALAAFCFSMTVGVLWEFFEFTADQVMHTDMQKDYVVHEVNTVSLNPDGLNVPVHVQIESVIVNGEDWTEQLGGYLDIGLIDTMKDLLVNFIGAVVFSIFGFFYVKHRGKGKLAAALIPVVLDPEKEKSKKDEQNREPNDE